MQNERRKSQMLTKDAKVGLAKKYQVSPFQIRERSSEGSSEESSDSSSSDTVGKLDRSSKDDKKEIKQKQVQSFFTMKDKKKVSLETDSRSPDFGHKKVQNMKNSVKITDLASKIDSDMPVLTFTDKKKVETNIDSGSPIKI